MQVKKPSLTNYDELLIEAIKIRPCLWNYNLPTKDRTPMILSEAWMDVVEDLGGKFELDIIKRRWKMLKTCFKRTHKKIIGEVIDGAYTSEDGHKESFKFYEEMLFLKNSGIGKKLKAIELPEQFEGDNSNDSLMSCLQKIIEEPKSFGKRKRSIADSKEFQKELIQKLTPPPECTRKLDGVDGFLIQLEDSLRRLPSEARQVLERKISQLVLETEEDCQLLIVADGEVIFETHVQ